MQQPSSWGPAGLAFALGAALVLARPTSSLGQRQFKNRMRANESAAEQRHVLSQLELAPTFEPATDAELNLGAKLALALLVFVAALVAGATLLDLQKWPRRMRGSLAYELLLAFSLRQSAAHIFKQRPSPPTGSGAHTGAQCMQCGSARSRLSSLSNMSELSAGSGGAPSGGHHSSTAGLLEAASWCRRAHQYQPLACPSTDRRQMESQSIDSLHGLKFLSMIWIIVIHSYDFAYRWSFFANPTSYDTIYRTALSQLLANGTFACDSFFFAAGFLLPYFTFPPASAPEAARPAGLTRASALCGQRALHQQHTNEGAGKQGCPGLGFYFQAEPVPSQAPAFTCRHLFKNLLHRYIRMLPLMMAIIGLSTSLLRYMGAGPGWDNSTVMFDKWCRKNWWLNGLFLHNFINRENMCLSHTWYSAVDMQLFLVGQLLMLVLFRSRKCGLILMLGLLFVTQLVTGILTILYHLPAVPLLAGSSEATMNLYYGYIYIKPYCRASPYLVGMLLAYLMRTTWLGKVKLSQVALGWTCAIGTNLAILLAMQPAMNGRPLGELESALYSSLSRTLWACAVGWMVFACITGHAGPFEVLFGAKFFAPFSRLTYPAFLIHPIVMTLFYASRQSSAQFSHYLMLYLVIGNIVITYISAFVLATFFELPILSIERILKSRPRRRPAEGASAATASSPLEQTRALHEDPERN